MGAIMFGLVALVFVLAVVTWFGGLRKLSVGLAIAAALLLVANVIFAFAIMNSSM